MGSRKGIASFQPIKSIHLNSNRKDTHISPPSDERYSFHSWQSHYLSLLMACAKFHNLSTATQAPREKEISIQKFLERGNLKSSLVTFFLETVVIVWSPGVWISLRRYRYTLFQSNQPARRCNYFLATWFLIFPYAHFTLVDCKSWPSHLTSLAGLFRTGVRSNEKVREVRSH